jgi:5'-nucleotidase
MKLFLTNDDGIFGKGLNSLAKSLADGNNEVFVIAPDRERSACGHSLTINNPIKYNKINLINGVESYKTDGTPADCVKFGLSMLYKGRPDLLISGINYGANLGTDILYSGTVSAAFEGRILGQKAIAVSIPEHQPDEKAVQATVDFIKQNLEVFCSLEMPEKTVLNINHPNTPEPKGVRLATMGFQEYDDEYIKGTVVNMFLLKGKPIKHYKNAEDTDVELCRQGYITITPISFNLTDNLFLESLKHKGIF